MSKSVANVSGAVGKMRADAAKGRALMGGTKAMRKAGEEFLPRFPQESLEAYEARKNGSFLFNGYKKTVKDMTGRVFDKPVEVQECPDRLIDWCENADMQGRDLSTFARDVFENVFDAGVSYIMVDAPRREGEVTLAQAQNANLRPYLVHLTVEDVLGWKTAVVDNVTVLSQLRIMECVKEQDPKDEFEQIEINQVRVMDRTDTGVSIRIFRKVEKQEEWALYDEYESAADEITIIPFYANRTGFFTGEPVLEDLADKNIEHWQSASDQRNILHAARVPILFAAGRDEDEDIVIGASKAVTSRDPQATLQWVEHSGAAIGAGRDDLKDLEFQMEVLGLQLLVARSETATGATLDAAKETSQLAMMADALRDALEQALLLMCDYGGLADADVSVAVNDDFGVGLMTAQEALALLSSVNTGQLSRETFLRELARRGMIRSDIDPMDEAERIESEGGQGLSDGLGE